MGLFILCLGPNGIDRSALVPAPLLDDTATVHALPLLGPTLPRGLEGATLRGAHHDARHTNGECSSVAALAQYPCTAARLVTYMHSAEAHNQPAKACVKT
jgi:hypothetical protein